MFNTHGECHNWVVLNTVKDADKLPSIKRCEFIQRIGNDMPEYIPLKEQRKFWRMLDVGSLDICGSQRTYKLEVLGGASWIDLVSVIPREPETYVGIDIVNGAGVDCLMNSHKMSFRDGYADLVLCLNMLEHDDDKQATFDEMYRVLEPGGLLIVTCSSEDGPEHGDEWGYFGGISASGMLEYLKGYKDVWVVKDGGYMYAKANR